MLAQHYWFCGFAEPPPPPLFFIPCIYIYTSVLRYIHVIRAVGVGVTLKTGDTSEDNLSRKDIELIRVIFQPSTSTFSSPSFLNFIPPSLLHHVAAPPTNLETILKSAFEEGSFEKGARKREKKEERGNLKVGQRGRDWRDNKRKSEARESTVINIRFRGNLEDAIS